MAFGIVLQEKREIEREKKKTVKISVRMAFCVLRLILERSGADRSGDGEDTSSEIDLCRDFKGNSVTLTC